MDCLHIACVKRETIAGHGYQEKWQRHVNTLEALVSQDQSGGDEAATWGASTREERTTRVFVIWMISRLCIRDSHRLINSWHGQNNVVL